jgi:IS1 family transposase
MELSAKDKRAAQAFARLGGLKGGKARAEALTPEQRKEIAREAATARWAKEKENANEQDIPKASHSGVLTIGDISIPCAVIEVVKDGVPIPTRVLSENGITNALLGSRSGASKRRKRALQEQGAPIPLFLAPRRLHPFISEDLLSGPLKPIIYRVGRSIEVGFDAQILPAICDIWLKARDAGILQDQQLDKAKKAEILMRGLANVAIIALVDEATGYQAERDRNELHKILAAFISEELLPWAKRFPDEFYQQMFRSALVEGNSIRSTERMTQTHRDTIMRLLRTVGDGCQQLLDHHLRSFHSRHLQVDEIWTFVGKKQAQLTEEEHNNPALGDQYVFVALDADTKLIPTFLVGKRDGQTALQFMIALQKQLANNGRIQLTTDGLLAYRQAVEATFGAEIDYAQAVKLYAAVDAGPGRYSPLRVAEVVKTVMLGNPNPDHISTSYIERQNLTMRMAMRRFTRLTNAFSKKLANLKAALALHFAHYNFMRVRRTLRVTPAMEAGMRVMSGHGENF